MNQPKQDAYSAAADEVAALEREVGRLTDAIAMGTGDLGPLVEALQARQARRAELLEASRRAAKFSSTPKSRKAIEGAVRERLTDWRSLLTRNVQDARQLLRQVLSGPLKFTPQNGAYRFEG